ncbi:MAG: FecR domain-containing protein [Candidatus Pseudobacter hemicellulosilyticus]|uniref:FecR domain-containing protein n=1 Tax=Candidatus Pseudobacter hemicellulosilyticus TaxID=3121375 RepID=A0AAJ5WT20_9BACT|nr:MAG: FecR domain-containing protein [Pseudobacter sp.]
MMQRSRYSRLLIVLSVVLVVAAVVLLLMQKNEEAGSVPPSVKEDTVEWTGPPKDTFPYLNHTYTEKWLADSSRVILLEGAKLNPHQQFPANRQVKADGDMIFDVRGSARPFVVRTRLLVLTAEGPCVFRIVAYSHESGEEVQVLKGTVRAAKSYKSDFPEPDTLRNQQLLMINDTIDLMEKENDDRTELHDWWALYTHTPIK